MRRLAGAVIALSFATGCDLVDADRPATGDLPTIGPASATRVVRVVDGDTLVAEVDGRRVTVRLIGVDAPELARNGQPAEPLSGDAAAALETILDDGPVILERDRSETDRFGRLLRYAWQRIDGRWRLVNEELVRLGMAEARAYPPDTARQDHLDAAETAARDAGRGIWARPWGRSGGPDGAGSTVAG